MKEVRWTKLFGGNPPPAATHIVDIDAAILGAVGGFALGAAVVTGIDWVLAHGAGISLLPDQPLHEHVRYWLHAVLGDEMWTRYLEWIDSLKTDWRFPSYIARLGAVAVLPFWLAFKAAQSGMAERERFIHRAGRQLLAGQRANDVLKRKTGIECKADGSGLILHPSVTLSLRRETGHILVMGSSGGGKTVILKPFIWRAVARGDKCLIYDNKGEITEELSARFVLIAPWDNRSAAWDIAADCRNLQDARELSAKFIPDSKDPMWSAAARQIFTAMLSELMHTRGKDWGWTDLAEMVVKTNQEVKDIVARRVPEAMDAVADAESKTTLSIMITMKAFMSDVLALAEAWRDKPGHRKRRRISFTRFVTDPDYRYKRIVLQGSGRYRTMTQRVIGGILQSVSAVMNSGACPDSPTRRIWLFIDEFPQLGKVDGFNAFLELGRSKGFRVAVGVQDYNQLTQTYSKEECDTFLSQIKTQVFVKFPAGPTAEWVSNLVGTRRVQMPQQSVSSSVGGPGGEGTASVCFNETDLPVIHPAALEAKLGTSPEWSGVQGLVLGWDDAYFLRWPFVPTKKLRPAVIEADWCTILRDDPTGMPDAPPVKPEDGNMSAGVGDEMNFAEDVGQSHASRPKKKFILRGKGEGEEAREA